MCVVGQGKAAPARVAQRKVVEVQAQRLCRVRHRAVCLARLPRTPQRSVWEQLRRGLGAQQRERHVGFGLGDQRGGLAVVGDRLDVNVGHDFAWPRCQCEDSRELNDV